MLYRQIILQQCRLLGFMFNCFSETTQNCLITTYTLNLHECKTIRMKLHYYQPIYHSTIDVRSCFKSLHLIGKKIWCFWEAVFCNSWCYNQNDWEDVVKKYGQDFSTETCFIQLRQMKWYSAVTPCTSSLDVWQ